MFRLCKGHYQGQVTVTMNSYVYKMQVVHIEKYMQIKFKILKGVINLDVRICAIISNIHSNICETLFSLMEFVI